MTHKRTDPSDRLMTAIGILQNHSIAGWHLNDGIDRWGGSYMTLAPLEHAIEMLIELTEDFEKLEAHKCCAKLTS